MSVQNRLPCRLQPTAGSPPRLGPGAGGLRRGVRRRRRSGLARKARFEERRRPKGCGERGSAPRDAPERAFLRFAPEGNPLKCKVELFWRVMSQDRKGVGAKVKGGSAGPPCARQTPHCAIEGSLLARGGRAMAHAGGRSALAAPCVHWANGPNRSPEPVAARHDAISGGEDLRMPGWPPSGPRRACPLALYSSLLSVLFVSSVVNSEGSNPRGFSPLRAAGWRAFRRSYQLKLKGAEVVDSSSLVTVTETTAPLGTMALRVLP